MEAEWLFPEKKNAPLAISYNPHLINYSENFMNPFLGYANCPIVGRYSQGQYKIGQTLIHVQFKCKFNEQKQKYECGNRDINIPDQMLYNLRNIPEDIINNKAAGLKNSPQMLPQIYPVLDELSIIWVISFGQFGKDFLNYLNHMYILACTLFLEQKFQRSVHFLPIYAHLPAYSGLMTEQVERGLNFKNYRGQYLSFHLKKGAPAFSPNNMRLGVEGGVKVGSNSQQQQQNNKKKVKYIQKSQYAKTKQQKKKENNNKIILDDQQQMDLNVNQIEQKIIHVEQLLYQQNTHKTQNIKNAVKNIKKTTINHQGFIHFYSSILLENDYRIYYHWHIQDQNKEDIIKQILKNSQTIEQFIQKYTAFVGEDPLTGQLIKILLKGFKQQ